MLALVATIAASAAAEVPATVRVDPAARLLDADGAGEAWDVTARLEGGAYFLVRFWVTNEGPGSHTGIAMGYFVAPDGKVSRFRYGRERERWESAADGRFMRVASAVLDLRPPSGSVEIDTNKGGMKIYLRFDMPAAPDPVCALRDGGSGFDVLRLNEQTDGIAWVEGLTTPISGKGTIDITHAWSAESEIDTLLRRIDVSGVDGDIAFFATTMVAPKAKDSPSSCLAVLDGGKKVFESAAVKADTSAPRLAGTEERFPVPSRIELRDAQVTLEIGPEREMLRVNPLEVVPQPFRMLLGLRSSPQRLWADGAWSLKLERPGAKKIERSGRGVTAVTYTNPW